MLQNLSSAAVVIGALRVKNGGTKVEKVHCVNINQLQAPYRIEKKILEYDFLKNPLERARKLAILITHL